MARFGGVGYNRLNDAYATKEDDEEGDNNDVNLLKSVKTSDESWLYGCNIDAKAQSVQQKSSGAVLFSFFFELQLSTSSITTRLGS